MQKIFDFLLTSGLIDVKYRPMETNDSGDEKLKAKLTPLSCLTIDVSNLTEHDWLQVDMAARGCISGRLYEWPHLSAAFKRAGLEAQPSTGTCAVRDIARLLLMLSPDNIHGI